MTIRLVNGYTCETSCEVALAKAGRDPHPTRQDPIERRDGTATPGASAFQDPAVTFGGILSADAVKAVTPAGQTAATTDAANRPPGGALDIRV